MSTSETKRTLVVLDFSGTLSTGSVLFGEPDTLARALDASGLAAFGINSADRLWSRVVDPSWAAGSTGVASYASCIARTLTAPASSYDPKCVQAAAEAFVTAYFAASPIDRAWRPFLGELTRDPDLLPLIATDHYLEATPHITAELARHAVSAAAWHEGVRPDRVTVANSADLGATKTTRKFWESISAGLPALGERPAQVLVLDDFGANELAEDDYSSPAMVETRRQRVETLLSVALGAPVHTLPCRLPIDSPGDALESALAGYIDEARRALALQA